MSNECPLCGQPFLNWYNEACLDCIRAKERARTQDRGGPPWYERLTPDQMAWLFPKGRPQIEEFLQGVELQERAYGIPAKCEDPETLMRVARVVTRPLDQPVAPQG